MDEVVTLAEALRWLPPAIQREWADAERAREMTLPPEQRGWWTAQEIDGQPGEWIEISDLSSAEPRYIPGRPTPGSNR